MFEDSKVSHPEGGNGTASTTTAAATAPATPDLSAVSADDLRHIAPEEKETLVHEVFQRVSEDYDKMNDVISFGMHRGWKRTLIDAITALKPSDVLDVATGTGDIALWIAERNPSARVVGADFSENMLSVAERRLAASPLTNVSFSHQNAMSMSFPDNSFDAVSVSFGMRNMPDYGEVIGEMTRVLRPGGTFFCLESSYPTNPVIKPLFRFYFKQVMPTLGRVIGGAPEEYRYLNDSTEAFLTKEELAALMRERGLEGVSYRSFMFGGAALHSGTKPTA